MKRNRFILSIILLAALCCGMPYAQEAPGRPDKYKTVVQGKKHANGLFKSFIGPTPNDPFKAGEAFGYEFHAKSGETLYLDKVGFYQVDGPTPMTHMKFRIDIYNMSNVKEEPSDKFVAVPSSAVDFSYNPDEVHDGKFVYTLAHPVALPKDAMVAIVMLEDMTDEKLWYKSNMLGKNVWSPVEGTGYWCKCPFAPPFFVECMAVKDR